MKVFVLVFTLIFIQFQLFSQKSLFETERELTLMFDSIFSMEESPEREQLNNKLLSIFKIALEDPDATYFKWSKLKKIGKVNSEDNKLMIYTWHLPYGKGEYKYYGLLRYNIGKVKKNKQDIVVHSLNDVSDQLKNPALLELSVDKWFGALYFGIKSYKNKRNIQYALFGYDFHDNYSQKKIIEILEFDKNGNAVFSGKFDMDFQEFKRIIFEYSDNIAMTLRYDERLDLIIYDHLSPYEPIFSGMYRFYSPDGSYDGLKFNKSTFHVEKDVDARNE